MSPRSSIASRAPLSLSLATVFAAVALALRPETASAQSIPTAIDRHESVPTLGVSAGAGYLASPGAHGAAADVGIRAGFGRHIALGFDYGWGLLRVEHAATVQDRWRVMPWVARVVPAGSVTFDLGAGLGLATASGYPSASAFAAGPFAPGWAFQLAPAVRAHASVMVQVAPAVDLFARVKVGALLPGGNRLVFRSGNDDPALTETAWALRWLGVHYRLR